MVTIIKIIEVFNIFDIKIKCHVLSLPCQYKSYNDMANERIDITRNGKLQRSSNKPEMLFGMGNIF